MTERKWSKYQTAIFDWVTNTNDASGNLMVEAVAGSGKTTTGVEAFKLLPENCVSIFVAFNKHIQLELQQRLPQTAIAMTYHALGFKAIRDAFGKVAVDGYKNDTILKSRIGKNLQYLFGSIKQITSLFKSNNEEFDYEIMKDTISYYGIDIGDDDEKNLPIIAKEVEYLLRPDHIEDKIIDFDDMTWLPIKLKLPCPKYDFIFVDEVQDTNKVQMELALMHVNGYSRIAACGDKFQSIYGWRGADVNSISNLTNKLQADILPLSITYRNPTKVIDLVKSKYPHILIEPRENAPEGIVEDISYDKALPKMVSGDMILCRLNAPLVQPCMQLISQGRKAIIKGKDIGKNLVVLIKKIQKLRNPYNIYEFMSDLKDFTEIETQKLYMAEKFTQATILQDKCDTIIALAEGSNSVYDLIYKTEMIFNDETEGITFSTVHKAKGLEAESIYILRPDLIPFSRAKLPWQVQQEANIEYVAYTRSLNNLFFIR